MPGRHAKDNKDRPGKRLQVTKEVAKELGDAVKKAKETKKK